MTGRSGQCYHSASLSALVIVILLALTRRLLLTRYTFQDLLTVVLVTTVTHRLHISERLSIGAVIDYCILSVYGWLRVTR